MKKSIVLIPLPSLIKKFVRSFVPHSFGLSVEKRSFLPVVFGILFISATDANGYFERDTVWHSLGKHVPQTLVSG